MIRDDVSLDPIFERHVARWNLDLPKMVGKHAAQSGDGRARGSLRTFLEFAFRPLYPAGDLGHLAPLPIRPRS